MIRLPRDDADALHVLLQVAHLKFDSLPGSLSLDQLYKLSVVCDKYDAAGAFKPFIEKYMSPHLPNVHALGYEHLLVVSHTFGMKKVAKQVMRSLVLNANCLTEKYGAMEDG